MKSSPLIRVKTLPHFSGNLPHYQTAGASGCDVCAALSEDIVLEPMKRTLVPTGLVLEIPTGFEIQVRPRSGLAIKSGVTCLNTPGTIDADYRGELKIILVNLGDEPFRIRSGDRIAQLVVAPSLQAQWQTVDHVNSTHRGEGGFGSTGL